MKKLIKYKSIPTCLTVIRICLVPLIFYALSFEKIVTAHVVGVTLFILAIVTDYLDGWLAKKFNNITVLGTILDPIADKILVISVIILLIKKGKVSEIPCLLIILREHVISGIRQFLSTQGISLVTSKLSKIKTLLQMSSLLILISCNNEKIILLGNILIWLTAIITILSAFLYISSIKINNNNIQK